MKSCLCSVAAACVVIALPASAESAQAQRLAAAARVVAIARAGVAQATWEQARCVAAIPDFASLRGDRKGVMSCRAGDRWTAPVFLRIDGGNWRPGPGQAPDVVLLVVTDAGVQSLLQTRTALGMNSSGILAVATTGASIDLSGAVVSPDEDANHQAYGSGATPRKILALRELSAPTEANAFLNALAAANGNAGPTAIATPGKSAPGIAPTAAPETAGADDVHARIVDMQQLVDRLLADANRSPVGTLGATDAGGDTVPVDRARLLQLRQQLEALLAAVSRK